MEIKKPMKVLFMPTNVTPVNFWRMKQFCDCMRTKNIDSIIYGYQNDSNVAGEWEGRFAQDPNAREEIYKLLRYCDVAVIGYLHFPQALSIMIFNKDKKFFEKNGMPDNTIAETKGPKKLVCEIDDLLLSTPTYNPAFKGGYKPGSGYEKVAIRQMQESNLIINSTEFLAKRHSCFNRKTEVIPNCIDFKRWDVPVKKNKRVRIGWIGGGNHGEDLRVLCKVVKPILRKYKDVEFYFVHGVPDYLKKFGGRVKWDACWSKIETYPSFLASYGFDIGLAPLDVNSFNHGKSNLRYLEYSALRIPTVATRIEPYQNAIKQGENGLLSVDSGEWVANISKLIENKDLRLKMGNSAYDTVKRDYNLEKVTDTYIRVLKGIR